MTDDLLADMRRHAERAMCELFSARDRWLCREAAARGKTVEQLAECFAIQVIEEPALRRLSNGSCVFSETVRLIPR